MNALEKLFSRRRFGMKMGLETMLGLSRLLGDKHKDFDIVHIAGTNGKGAVAAMLDAILRGLDFSVFRYTSPHLVKLNERYFFNGTPVDNSTLEKAALSIIDAAEKLNSDVTFFEALTGAGILIAAEKKPDYAIFECGLGGRLDATNICRPRISVITRIGLDHCDYLGGTLREIAIEKAGIIKQGTPVVMGKNSKEAIDAVKKVAHELSAPFYYAPDIVEQSQLPAKISPPGEFNRENAITALAASTILGVDAERGKSHLSNVVWPGRFQQIGNIIVDGAHNPPAAKAIANEFSDDDKLTLIAGFCGDKDVSEVLKTLSKVAKYGFGVKTTSERSLSAAETSKLMQEAGIKAEASKSLDEAISKANAIGGKILITGSLYLAGEALKKLGAYPWGDGIDAPGELLKEIK